MMLMIMMMMGETESEKVTPLCFRACNFINTDQIYTKFRKKINIISFSKQNHDSTDCKNLHI